MKKSLLFGLAALAVGVVVYSLGSKKEKPTYNANHPYFK
jgi:hypothetical protein